MHYATRENFLGDIVLFEFVNRFTQGLALTRAVEIGTEACHTRSFRQKVHWRDRIFCREVAGVREEGDNYRPRRPARRHDVREKGPAPGRIRGNSHVEDRENQASDKSHAFRGREELQHVARGAVAAVLLSFPA